jgi:hypothetical protein
MRAIRFALLNMATSVAGLCLVVCIGCEEEYDYTPATGGGGGSTYNGTAPVPGPSADGWQSSYGGGKLGCGSAEADIADRTHVTVGQSTIYVGYQQVTSINQDPAVARYDNGQLVWCVRHETQGPDGRAVGITWDGGEYAYVVYTIVGGGSDLEGRGGWLSAYAPGAINGGGPTVSVIGRVKASNGELETATFVMAVLSNNKVNTHRPAGAVTVLTDGNVEFLGVSAHKPIDANGRESMDCTEYPFHSRYILSADLRSLVCCECTNCVSDQPCQ